MIKLSYEDIIKTIQEKKAISREDIENRINAKLKQLSGLISKEGAAHIIANELGIRLFDQFTGQLKIKNILQGMRSVETLGKVLQVYDVKEFTTNNREGKVGSFLIGDETGMIRIVIWGSEADKIRTLKVNSIVKIKNGYVKDNNGRKEVHLNDNGQLLTDIENVTININPDSYKTSTRKDIKDITENDSDIELLATIVQVFDIKFFEICDKCSRRVRFADDFKCQEHGIITPAYSYVLNLTLDDGTDNIRAVFFRNQLEALLAKNSIEILKIKDSPEIFEEIRAALLGTTIKVRGRCTKNQMFDRLEFISNNVHTNIDPEKEILSLSPQQSPNPIIFSKNKDKENLNNVIEEVPEEIIE